MDFFGFSMIFFFMGRSNSSDVAQALESIMFLCKSIVARLSLEQNCNLLVYAKKEAKCDVERITVFN